MATVKHFFKFLWVFLLGINSIFAQAPNAISFQGIARNNAGNLIVNQTVSLRFSIINTTAAGPTIYQETQSTTTNELGLFSVNIGAGTVVSGTMAAIDWKTNNKFLKVEIDPNGGTTYLNMGTQQFRSEVYALYAKKSNDGISNGTNNYVIKSNGTAGVNSIIVDNGSNVGIGVASPTEVLEIGSATNTSIKISGLATTSTITNSATDVAVLADADGTLRRGSAAGRDVWYNTGNNVNATTNILGTTSNQSINFITNNIVRGRLTNNGNLTWGTTTPVNSTDLVTVVSNATNTTPISGNSSNNGSGIWGEVMSANPTDHSAIEGIYNGSGTGSGIYGEYDGTNTNNVRPGVSGTVTSPASANGGIGVYGYNSIASGNQRIGVLGSYNSSAFGFGVVGIAFGGGFPSGSLDIAVVGSRGNNLNYSGYFNGNHVIANGTKSASVPTSKGNQLLYAIESPEVWFEDYGTASLVNGEAIVKLNPLFLETVAIDATHKMQVIIQMEDESEEVFITKGLTDFKVKESNNGKSNAAFTYKVIAKRLNFQDHRFGSDPVWQGIDNRKAAKYAPPPPIDYEENLKFQKQQALNIKENQIPLDFVVPVPPKGKSGSGEERKIK
jgi:hypothetical protein